MKIFDEYANILNYDLTEDPTTGALQPAQLTEDPTTGTLQTSPLLGPSVLLSTLTHPGKKRKEGEKKERE